MGILGLEWEMNSFPRFISCQHSSKGEENAERSIGILTNEMSTRHLLRNRRIGMRTSGILTGGNYEQDT